MMKRRDNNPEYSREREFKVILEDLHGQFKVFGEGQEDMRRGLNRIEDRVQNVEDKVAHLEVEMSFVRRVLPTLATKDDLIPFATKDDLIPFATKDDLIPLATKEDLKQLEKRLIALESTR